MASSPSTSEAGFIAAPIRLLASVSLLLLLASCVRGQSAQMLEYQVKAAILYKITRFVEWPARQGDATFCVVGEDPFGPVLDETLRGKRVNERPIVLRRCRTLRELAGCELVFISASEAPRVPAILRAADATGVLTVSEIPGFAVEGGMINFVLEAGRVRFEINQQAVEQAGLRIRSQLLEMARIVKPRGKGKS